MHEFGQRLAAAEKELLDMRAAMASLVERQSSTQSQVILSPRHLQHFVPIRKRTATYVRRKEHH